MVYFTIMINNAKKITRIVIYKRKGKGLENAKSKFYPAKKF